jgi:hypothetical protein
MTVACPIVEPRQYTLRRGQRDVLISLFDREFVETQEAAGMAILGQGRPRRYRRRRLQTSPPTVDIGRDEQLKHRQQQSTEG